METKKRKEMGEEGVSTFGSERGGVDKETRSRARERPVSTRRTCLRVAGSCFMSSVRFLYAWFEVREGKEPEIVREIDSRRERETTSTRRSSSRRETHFTSVLRAYEKEERVREETQRNSKLATHTGSTGFAELTPEDR